MNTQQDQTIPDLSSLMEHTPHTQEHIPQQPEHPQRSRFLLASGILLFLFMFVSLGVLLYQNQQNENTDLRSQAAEFGDLTDLQDFSANNEASTTTTTTQECQNITFIKNGQSVPKSEIKPGDTIRLVVPKGQYTKAEFVINNVPILLDPEANKSNEFSYAYTFPPTATTVSIRVNLSQ